MFNKISTKNLIGLFVVLLVIVIYLLFFSSGEERSFREELVDIDTTKVGEIDIYPKDKKNSEINLTKEAGKWSVKLPGNKTAPVPESKIHEIFNSLIGIKPTSLAARDKSKWHEFQVDSSGTRVKVLENGNTTLDIVIGRFAFQQPRSVSTYVRLYNDADVYETEGFLGMTFGRQTVNSYRNQNIIHSNKTKWTSLTYHYPSDSSFVLVKSGKRWKINNTLTDSIQTEHLLNNLESVTSSKFADNFTPAEFQSPVYKLIINTSDTTQIQVDAYADSSKIVLHSSQNPESYFEGTKDLKAKIFLSPKRFFKK